MTKSNFTHRCIALSAMVLLGACATQKSRYDQSSVGKLYHDVTAEFNGYFNAKEIVLASIEALNNQYQDNYADILPVYKYHAAPNPEAVAADLDNAIKKVSVVATLHEASKWVDDCYLVIGKAFYLKQDYESAENALEFFLDEFYPDGTRVVKRNRKKSNTRKSSRSAAQARAENERERRARAKEQERERKRYNKELRKKKKKSNRKKEEGESAQPKTARNSPPVPAITLEEQQRGKAEPIGPKFEGEENPGGLNHVPAYQEASLWLARTYVDRENYPAAERLLNGLKANPNIQDDVQSALPVAYAYYALSRKNYAGAIPHLEQAIELAKKNDDRARYAFILGQVAERDENYTVAISSYENVLKNHPDYTLSFNAKLSLARVRLQSGEQSLADVTALLEKMLRDDKNTEFQDQIYFALARINLHEHDIPGAIANLQLAAQFGTGNPVQLTETNLLLADLYYAQGDYVEAKAAYDAVLGTMNKADERYRRVERLSKNLTDIALHLTTIQEQDSLLRISLMTPAEREILAKQLFRSPEPGKGDPTQVSPVNVKSGARGGVASAGGPGAPGRPSASTPSSGASTQTSNFFAYNQKEVKRGLREFEHDWGTRSLSDNWRLAALAGPSAIGEDIEQEDEKPADVLTEKDLQQIFRDVPDTDAQKAAAHEKIQNAMLQLGSLYRDKLEDYGLSIDVLEKLLEKYPDTKYALDAYYQLYLSYYSMGNFERSEYYKNKIITEFAASKYALVLTDPDYLSKQLSEEQRLDRDYQEVYELVEGGQFAEARKRIDAAKQTFGTNHKFQAKYSILEAMCIGNEQGKDAYVEALKAVISGYPGTPEEIKARDMLLLLDAYQGSRLNLTTSSAPDFKVAPDIQHFLLVRVTGFSDSDAQDVKVSISNYNRKYHSLDKLKISSLRFDTKGDEVIILVRSFKDGAAAMKYLSGVAKNSAEFVPDGIQYEAFAVTQSNYREIVKQKSLDAYREFYKENYK